MAQAESHPQATNRAGRGASNAQASWCPEVQARWHGEAAGSCSARIPVLQRGGSVPAKKEPGLQTQIRQLPLALGGAGSAAKAKQRKVV